ncbi:MAG: hypothetical protein LLG01_01045 [Planctomycetaceae bacterium]|nr:hypothetical protein [Planctomycetaceae bacterium]
MWETTWDILKHPFTWGLLIGLFAVLMIAYVGIVKRLALKRQLAERDRQIADLKSYLATHLDVTAQGAAQRQGQLEELRQQNENLRVAVAALQDKPDRRERRTLEVYQRALEMMNENAPAFATVWQACVRRAEEELAAAQRGTISRVWNKIFPRQVESHALPQDTSEEAAGKSDAPDTSKE